MYTSYLKLHNFEFQTYLGVYPEEQLQPQTVLFNAIIEVSLTPSQMESDNIDYCYCYEELSREIQALMTKRKSFKTLEALTWFLWKTLKDSSDKGSLQELTLTKKQLPLSVNASGVSFTINRQSSISKIVLRTDENLKSLY